MIAKYPVSVKALIRKDDAFMMIRAATDCGVELGFPGGLVEEGESLEDALKREVLEETGLKISVGPVVNAAKYVHPRSHGEDVGIYFSAEVTGGEQKLGGEHDKKFLSLDWVTPEKAPDWAKPVMRAVLSQVRR